MRPCTRVKLFVSTWHALSTKSTAFSSDCIPSPISMLISSLVILRSSSTDSTILSERRAHKHMASICEAWTLLPAYRPNLWTATLPVHSVSISISHARSSLRREHQPMAAIALSHQRSDSKSKHRSNKRAQHPLVTTHTSSYSLAGSRR